MGVETLKKRQYRIVPCKGYQDSFNGEYECEYLHSDTIMCDMCIINGGNYDPRTGKKAPEQLIKLMFKDFCERNNLDKYGSKKEKV